MVNSRAHYVNAALLIVLVAGGVIVFERLLEPVIALALSAMCYGLAWMVGAYPHLMNVPDQAKYDALSEENKRKVIAIWQRFAYWFTTTILVLFSVMQVSRHDRVPITPDNSAGIVLIAVIAIEIPMLVLAGWAVMKTIRTVKELHEAEHRRAE